MSTEHNALSASGYWVLRWALVLWGVVLLGSHTYYWIAVATGQSQPAWLQVQYESGMSGELNSVPGFVISSVLTGLLLLALFHGFRALTILARDERSYRDLVAHLARFSTTLALYSIAAALSTIVLASIGQYQDTGQFSLILVLNGDRISLLIISIVLYLVCNALREASEAVEENQSFL